MNFVLQGLVFSGHEFGMDQDTPSVLGRRSAENVLGLCRREQLQVDDAMTTAIIRWVGGARSLDG